LRIFAQARLSLKAAVIILANAILRPWLFIFFFFIKGWVNP